ncbi:MAG TPA: hypothetical protein VK463_14195 [Desulfomonilaceae bacterium]|nr:hypothetical protein [Desulfomonilaceae bacterium]
MDIVCPSAAVELVDLGRIKISRAPEVFNCFAVLIHSHGEIIVSVSLRGVKRRGNLDVQGQRLLRFARNDSLFLTSN